MGIGANTPEEAVYPGALADRDGNLLDAHAPLPHHVPPSAQLPPERAFWSLTMYDLQGFLSRRLAVYRYAIGPFHPPLVTRRDGSVVVAIQRDKPAESDVNWLPTPATGNFRLNLRIYAPERSVLTGARGSRRRSSPCREAALLRRRPKRFGAWLEEHHETADEVQVGFYKVASGKPSVTYQEALDEALSFGWIDGVRKGGDTCSYTIRFTPRKPTAFGARSTSRRSRS